MSVVLSYVPSTEGRGALSFGFAEARMRGTDLMVIAEDDSGSSPEFESDLDAARQAAGAADVVFAIEPNDPALSHADNLIDASYRDDVELIVIGIRRRSPVGKLLTGSAMQRVLLDAQCPVAAVKPPVRSAV
ncbi:MULTISPECIES: universal stress protein [Actinomycetes]|jgi:nucleotide-binding universal stress UspA family protein|uniref:Nucleotide-binding universal stress UspA family protein n=1 Tax=Williamsia marianensis TaxID=85044 RepID=A0A315SI29_WILMA|nr:MULTISPECIES: universal stress protein [Actinomycetes]ETD30116.1 universal stress protein [Williamsia sp. D3]MDV7136944.1 universal stress protein [Williamsia muralis]PVY34191.1 nucleotide-binding universal stress UspA family protein [Williamsia marianensis]RKR94681.1 nucleotide-binding universal stress UspA family protein [Williamsia muralis]